MDIVPHHDSKVPWIDITPKVGSYMVYKEEL